MHTEDGKLHAHPSPAVLHDTLICEGSPVRARWTCKTYKCEVQGMSAKVRGSIAFSCHMRRLRLLPPSSIIYESH